MVVSYTAFMGGEVPR